MYDVILADPPWAYRNLKTGGSHTSGAAQKYPTLTMHEIADLPVAEVVARDSVCFLWATTPLGRDPFTVLEQWGFGFKTKWYWHKTGRKGTGYWTRGEVEEVLIGVRGKVKAWRSSLSNYIEGGGTLAEVFALDEGEDRGDFHTLHTTPEGHSRKPAQVQARIEVLMPTARRLELFATQTRPGWDTFGLALDPAHDFRTPEFWDVLRRTAEGPAPAVPAPALSALD